MRFSKVAITMIPAGVLEQELTRVFGPLIAEVTEYHGECGSLALTRAAFETSTIHEDERALTVVVGDPVLHLPNLSPRLLIDRSLLQSFHEHVALTRPNSWV